METFFSIIINSSKVLNVSIDSKGATELAKRSRGTPRLANRLLRRVRDFAEVKFEGDITEDVASQALDARGVRFRQTAIAGMEEVRDGTFGQRPIVPDRGA